ncbi:protein kinase domain protein [Gregarina niphandrodes]|uniref:non-specific serine/threonine protein kinase n=1 Tax=Gregarina niphandrodes TaxID=110365 RepID=A0A023B2W0_GRENI|nr:protein kinase domain protein [Gregarina niphandrodes]EZG52440.1 protein kinase domain protein [Gregarina niphandrodes]|eukprot:XP_011131896.1 protein kinase domain protein [Gregarina niphandrodes]
MRHGCDVDLRSVGYEHVTFLAEGSLGRLHIVKSTDDEVALWVAKLVDLTLLREPSEATQALLEAELLRRLRHPNIVEYANSFILDDFLVIIMEYCTGGDLHSYLQKKRDRDEEVPERQVFEWVRDICAGLRFMHCNNVLHCDVKSSNVFLDGKMTAKIGDLGIAKEIRRGARALSPLRCPRGTPVYMSPEMCQKEALTERSDCWAVGCIVYEICNLHHAFASNLHPADNDSVLSNNSGATAAFLPGVTNRSDLSLACKKMLKNIKGDLKRIKKSNVGNFDSRALKHLEPQQKHLSYWSKNSVSFPQVLPDRYCPLLNYMVCAMLEPQPSDRPTLTEVIQLAEAALVEHRSICEHHCDVDDDLDSIPEERTPESDR